MTKTIGIVGAGISGLLACKYALAKGYHPLVFEAKNTIGGVWTKTLETTKLQTPKSYYQFSDFPWPSYVETLNPTQQEVYDYIQSYSLHFNLLKHIRFNTKVTSIKYEGPYDEEMIQSWAFWGGNGDPFGDKGSKWIITTHDLLSSSIEVIEVDFVILCLGRFSDVPNMPKFPLGKGPEVFEGHVMHSMNYSALDFESAQSLIKGRRVAIVGYQKSALDIAMECSKANGVGNPCTIICRTPHWIVDESFPWKIRLYSNRFSQLLLHKPGEGPLLNLLASILSPLRWGISKFAENVIKKSHSTIKKYGMLPDHSFLQEMSSCSVAAIPTGFYEHIEKGSIIFKRSPKFIFNQEGVILIDNDYDDDNNVAMIESIKCDLVIFATGFRGDQKLKDIFESPKFQDYIFGCPTNTFPLYRECIPPRIPQIAVIGFSESGGNLLTSEIRCRWLFELLDGKFKLPSIEDMEKDVSEWDMFMKRYSGKYYRRSCMGALHIWYYDLLCKDMGLNPWRKKGLWAEFFEPYGPLDYA